MDAADSDGWLHKSRRRVRTRRGSLMEQSEGLTESAGGQTPEHFDAGFTMDHPVSNGRVLAPEILLGSRG